MINLKNFSKCKSQIFLTLLFSLITAEVQSSETSLTCEKYLSAETISHSDLSAFQDIWRREVGQRLKNALLQKGQADGKAYSKAQLSRDIKVDNSSVVKYSNGIYSIPLIHAQSISKVLVVELKWLLAQDLLIAFNVNGIKVQPQDFRGRGMPALADAFNAFVWSQPDVQAESDLKLESEINPLIFCIEDCSTEELVRELARRGWDINLRLNDQ